MKIRIDPLDELFSKVVRTKANGICQRCQKPTNFKRLQCAHFHGRANRRVRWDLDNAVGLCYGCHAYLDSRVMDKVEFFKKRLGEKNFEELNQRANWPNLKKVDQNAIKIFLEYEFKRISDSSNG